MTDDTTGETAIVADSTAASPPTPAADPTGGLGDTDLSAEVPIASSEGGEEAVSKGYSPDLVALGAAAGDPRVFGHEMYELIGHLTGTWIDEESLTGWFRVLEGQVIARTAKNAVFDVANTAVPAQIAGDPALLVLSFRDELVTTLRRSAGIA